MNRSILILKHYYVSPNSTQGLSSVALITFLYIGEVMDRILVETGFRKSMEFGGVG